MISLTCVKQKAVKVCVAQMGPVSGTAVTEMVAVLLLYNPQLDIQNDVLNLVVIPIAHG